MCNWFKPSLVGIGCKVVATSTNSNFALKINIFFAYEFKKFTTSFWVMKIKIDSARAPERS